MMKEQVKSAIQETIRTKFKQSILEGKGIPKFFLKMGAVKKEIDRLTAERKSKFGGEYAKKLNAESDPKKREQLKQPILAISEKISKLQANLASLYEKEEEYIQNLDKDTELDLAESVNEATYAISDKDAYDVGDIVAASKLGWKDGYYAIVYGLVAMYGKDKSQKMVLGWEREYKKSGMM